MLIKNYNSNNNKRITKTFSIPLDMMNCESVILWDVYGCVNLLREYGFIRGKSLPLENDELCDEYNTTYPWGSPCTAVTALRPVDRDVFSDKEALLRWADEIYSYLPCPSEDLEYDGDPTTSDPIAGHHLSGKTTRSLDRYKKKKRDDKPRRKPRNSGRR